MSDSWRDRYDSWKLAPGYTVYADEDFEWIPCKDCNGQRSALCGDCEAAARENWQAALDAQAEEVAEARAERAREDAMFDRENRDE